MIRLAAVAIAVALLATGCRSSDDGGDATAVAAGEIDADSFRGVDVGRLVEVNNVPHVLVPVGMMLNRKEAKASVASFLDPASAVDPKSTARLDDRGRASMEASTLYWPSTNLLVHNPLEGGSRLLFERPVVILRLTYDPRPTPSAKAPLTEEQLDRYPPEVVAEYIDRFAAPPADSTWPAGLVLLSVVDADTNDDGLLTEDDAAVAHALTLIDGQLRPLTPAGEDWQSWRRSDDGGRLYLRTLARGPGGRDEQHLYGVDLRTLAVTPIVTGDLARDAARAAGVRLP